MWGLKNVLCYHIACYVLWMPLTGRSRHLSTCLYLTSSSRTLKVCHWLTMMIKSLVSHTFCFSLFSPTADGGDNVWFFWLFFVYNCSVLVVHNSLKLAIIFWSHYSYFFAVHLFLSSTNYFLIVQLSLPVDTAVMSVRIKNMERLFFSFSDFPVCYIV